MSATAEQLPRRGRHAKRPRDIPRLGWRDVALRVKQRLGYDNVVLIAAGLALFALLALFPGLAGVAALYGMFSSSDDIGAQLQGFAAALPPDAMALLAEQLEELAGAEQGALGVGAVVTLALAFWSTRKGMLGLMLAMNVAYGEREKRGLLKLNLVAFLFALGAIVGFALFVLLAVAVPVLLALFPLGPVADPVLIALRWAALWLAAAFALAAVYRYAPARTNARWRWVSLGSTLAATLWLAASLLFALYLRHFDTLGEIYGALGGVVALLLWFFLSSFIVILGALINAESEHQTSEDTTIDPRAPMGRRGAHVADTLGHSP